nr:MAG TPA: hypothetical protein [Caudoviricetes sp.]
MQQRAVWHKLFHYFFIQNIYRLCSHFTCDDALGARP